LFWQKWEHAWHGTVLEGPQSTASLQQVTHAPWLRSSRQWVGTVDPAGSAARSGPPEEAMPSGTDAVGDSPGSMSASSGTANQ